jgi:isoleucyl-tRNA synthetase
VLPDPGVIGLETLGELICDELNVKAAQILADESSLVTLKAEPNFKTLGPKFGKDVNRAAQALKNLPSEGVAALARGTAITAEGMQFHPDDVTMAREPLKNWAVSADEGLTVALDLTISPDLSAEGRAREFVHLVQNYRRDADLEVTDRIRICAHAEDELRAAVESHGDWIRAETLAQEIRWEDPTQIRVESPEKVDRFDVYLRIEKI